MKVKGPFDHTTTRVFFVNQKCFHDYFRSDLRGAPKELEILRDLFIHTFKFLTIAQFNILYVNIETIKIMDLVYNTTSSVFMFILG